MDVSKLPMKVVGYWFDDKKCQKFGTAELEEACRKENIKLVKIDVKRPLEEQGPFDLLVHKFTALYALSLNNDAQAKETIRMFQTFLKNHPEIFIMDPLDGVYRLLLRNKTYELLEECTKNDPNIFTPSFVYFKTGNNFEENRKLIRDAGVTFPLVCKPLSAGGGSEAHQMSVVFNEKHIGDCKEPCVVQSFVNHGAVLYKLFVLGPRWFVRTRPSLKNFHNGVALQTNLADIETVHFHSHLVSKSDSCSPLTKLDPRDRVGDLPRADPAIFNQIVTMVRKKLNMDLLGIDVVMESSTGKYAIIDVNAFPSFEAVPNVLNILASLMRRRCDGTRCAQETVEDAQASGEGTDDSGGDTGYSSDQAKDRKTMREALKKKVASQAIIAPLDTREAGV